MLQVEILEKHLTKTHKFHSENFEYSIVHSPGAVINEPPKDSIAAESIKIKASFGQRDHEHNDGQEDDDQENGQSSEDGPGDDINNEVTFETSTAAIPMTISTSSVSTLVDIVTTDETKTETTKSPTEIPVLFTTREMTTENGSGDSTTDDQFTTVISQSTLLPTTALPVVEFSTAQSLAKGGF